MILAESAGPILLMSMRSVSGETDLAVVLGEDLAGAVAWAETNMVARTGMQNKRSNFIHGILPG